MAFEWVEKSVVMALHDLQLLEHGGKSGLRDAGLLDSALARPQNQAAYGNPSVCDLPAAYAFGIAKNHPFLDGNKRTAFVTAVVFLEVNGRVFHATEAEAVLQTLALASGNMTEEDFAGWLRANTKEA